jgi:hypothetical protein
MYLGLIQTPLLGYGGAEQVKGAKRAFGEAVELGGKFPSLFYIVILRPFIYLF